MPAKTFTPDQQVVLNATTPGYLRNLIGDNPDTSDSGLSGLLGLLNPLRGVPNSFYGDPPVNASTQDPAYINRLQSMVNGNVGMAAPFPGTGPTSAPATQGAGANLNAFQQWLNQAPPSLFGQLPTWAQQARQRLP